MSCRKVNIFRHGPLETLPAIRLGFVELVARFNDLVKAYNECSDTPVSFLALIDKPTTLAGYGIVDAAPLKHKHTVADITGLTPGATIVHWDDIDDTPTTLVGYGITDAAKKIHTHHWADIVDPPPLGGVGSQGPAGPPIPWFETAPPIEPMMIPGPQGKTGAAGAPGGGGGTSMPPIGALAFDERRYSEPPTIPGQRGQAGLAGAAGKQGLQGPPGLDAPRPEEPILIPGPQGKAGAAGGGGFAMLTTEVNLAASPKCSRTGKFTIAGAGMTVGKPVYIQQAAGPYTGKGTRADEAEMETVECKAYVKTAALIEVFWSSMRRVRGNYKFNYAVGA